MAHRTRPAAAAACLAGALIAAGCSPGQSEAPAGLGRAVHPGPVRALAPSPDGAALAFLDGCQEVKAPFLPPQTARCDLRVVPSAGGPAAKVAAGVTTLPQGIAWRADGKAVVAMADYDHAAAAATLVLWDGVAARKLADGVTFHGFGSTAGSGIAWISGGKLYVGGQEVRGADGVATFEFVSGVGACRPMNLATPDAALVARRTATSGGGLLAVDCFAPQARPLEAGQVGDYYLSREPTPHLAYAVQRKDGAELRVRWTPGLRGRDDGKPVAQRIGTFAFAPDRAGALAYVAGVVPGRQGDLHVVRLEMGSVTSRTVLARDVGEFRWAAAAPRLAWLEKYDARVRAGTLGVGGPGLAPRTLAARVSEFEVSSDGEHVAFLQHTSRGGYSVDLGLAHLDPAAATTAATVATGAFGFAFSPDAKWLYYRTRCVRNAEACDLERIPAAGLAPGAAPERIAEGVKSFEFDPRDPGRLLVGWQRKDLVALDVGVWEAGKLTRVDTAVLPGSASFLGPDSRRLAYVVIHPKRQGVYVAELPR